MGDAVEGCATIDELFGYGDFRAEIEKLRVFYNPGMGRFDPILGEGNCMPHRIPRLGKPCFLMVEKSRDRYPLENEKDRYRQEQRQRQVFSVSGVGS